MNGEVLPKPAHVAQFRRDEHTPRPRSTTDERAVGPGWVFGGNPGRGRGDMSSQRWPRGCRARRDRPGRAIVPLRREAAEGMDRTLAASCRGRPSCGRGVAATESLGKEERLEQTAKLVLSTLVRGVSCCPARANGIRQADWRVSSFTMRNTASSGWPIASAFAHPVRVSATSPAAENAAAACVSSTSPMPTPSPEFSTAPAPRQHLLLLERSCCSPDHAPHRRRAHPPAPPSPSSLPFSGPSPCASSCHAPLALPLAPRASPISPSRAFPAAYLAAQSCPVLVVRELEHESVTVSTSPRKNHDERHHTKVLASCPLR